MIKKTWKLIKKYIISILTFITLIMAAILPMFYENGYTEITVLSFTFVIIFGIITFYQNILSRTSTENSQRFELNNSIKVSKFQDVIHKIDQIHNKISDFNKRLHDISKEHELITAQGNRTAGDLACKVEDLKYDINFLCNHQINMMIPASLELKHPELKEMKKKIINGLGEVANKLDSYHSNDVENTEEGESSYSFPTIESDLFTKICETNSEFHKKLYTADSYITFPSEDIDNG